jgi:hypothetical protein
MFVSVFSLVTLICKHKEIFVFGLAKQASYCDNWQLLSPLFLHQA